MRILLAVVSSSLSILLVVGFNDLSCRQKDVQNSIHLPLRRALSPTTSIILTSFWCLDFYYLFHHNCVFISGCKPFTFCSVDREKHRVFAVLKSCDTVKHVSTDRQFFLKIKLLRYVTTWPNLNVNK